MSLHRTPPPRLKETHKGLQELSERSFSKNRLDANRELLEANIQSMPLGSTTWSFSKLMGIGIITALGATGLILEFSDDPTQIVVESTPSQNAPSSQAQSMNQAADGTLKVTKNPTESPNVQSMSAQKTAPQPATKQNPSEEIGKFKHMGKAPLRVGKQSLPQEKVKPRKTPKPDLALELEAFQRAKIDFQNEDYDKALIGLEKLQRDFANPKLRIEVLLLQAQTLFASEQPEPALRTLETLMQSSGAEPQGQWYKLLGDIQKSRGRCGQALIAYSKAIQTGLSEEQKNQVSSSVRACSRTQ